MMTSFDICKKVYQISNKKSIAIQINAMLNHFKTYNFLFNTLKNGFEFDFNSELLKQSILKEWLFKNTVFCDHPSFCISQLKTEDSLSNAFMRVKGMVSTLPISLIEVNSDLYDVKNRKTLECYVQEDLIKIYFREAEKTMLRNFTFCMPQNAVEVFHKLQREHKIWWRKFSALPGRFFTTEVGYNDKNKTQFVEIKADFIWGPETVESIHYFPDILMHELKNLRKKFLPHLVICETFLERATLTFLCDSFEKFNEAPNRNMLRFSKTLAPYKVSFAAHGLTADSIQNLKELAFLLAKKIKKCGISVLVLPDMSTVSIERQLLRNDALGIPYTILLNETTLKDGIISIRSRDTTLREQSHVSLIVSYIEKLMKSC